MAHSRYSDEEIARRGKELYGRSIRSQVETEPNIGKIVVLDIETGDFEIDDEGMGAAKVLHSKHPGAALWAERIGYDAVYAVGGTISRTPCQ